jgi:opacity protein-like surface antigen
MSSNINGFLVSLSLFCLIFYAPVSLATSKTDPHFVFNNIEYAPLVTFTVGPDFVNPGQAQDLILLPPFHNHYTSHNSLQSAFDGGVFIGLERRDIENITIQFGIAGYKDSQFSSQGDVWQFGLPLFDDLAYTYALDHARIMASSKLLTFIPSYRAIQPYCSIEIGTAFNNARDYQETPIIPDAVPTAPFGNHLQTSFAWGIGMGVDYHIVQHARIGVGYQFSDLGSASLAPTTAALTNQSLRLSQIYSNQLRFQLTVL